MKDRLKSDSSVKQTRSERKSTASQGGGEEECRCKEVSKKTPPELFRLMLKDLAFWKKK